MVAAVDGTSVRAVARGAGVHAARPHRARACRSGSRCRRRSPTATSPIRRTPTRTSARWSRRDGRGRRVASSPRRRTPTCFVRGYASGKETDAATQEAQFTLPARLVGADRPGHQLRRPRPSSATGRRAASCTGTPATRSGYTQFIASTQRRHALDGGVDQRADHAVERNPKRFAELRNDLQLAVCAALEGLTEEGDMEDRESPVLYLEMTEATPDEYARDRRAPRCARSRASSARRGGATCTATVPICPASCPSSTPSACTSATPSFVAPATPDGIIGPPLPAHAAPRTGSPDRQAHGVAVAGAHQPDDARRRRRRCATGATSCTSTTSSKPASPASR